MAQPKLLTNGNAFRRSDNRWGGTVWYADEIGERRRKSFSGTTKQEVTQKMADNYSYSTVLKIHSFRHTFATNLVNGVKQEDGSIKSLSPRQVADLLGHSISEVTEMYYVRRDTTRLKGITQGFDL